MQLTQDQLARIGVNISLLSKSPGRYSAAAVPSAALIGPWAYLQQSETELIELMSGQQPVTQGTEIDWGLALYLMNNELPSWMTSALRVLGMPASKITPQMLAQWRQVLSTGGVIASDGTLLADTTWAALDPGWLVALTSYLVYWLGAATPATFGTKPQTIALDGASTVKIALISDWGTGEWTDGSATCPSAAVLQALKNLSPDLVIHLGDVYYAGTSAEETNNLISPVRQAGLNGYTLNSNHEMYDGANGYFNVALAPGGPFAAQQGTSYFALTWNDVVIIGLDSAYYDTSAMYMAGALVDPGQIGFVKGLNLKGKTVVVLTHHNGLTTDGTAHTTLWSQVVSALGGTPPAFWYWGHVHNTIVYSAQSAAGPATRARCVGAGALPFGNGYGLRQNGSPLPSIDYYATTPFPNPDPQQANRVLNGFAMLTLSAGSGISETYYDQNGNQVWSPGERARATPSGS